VDRASEPSYGFGVGRGTNIVAVAVVAALGPVGCSHGGAKSASAAARDRRACSTLQHALSLYQAGVTGEKRDTAFRDAIADAGQAADRRLRDAIVATSKENLPGGAGAVGDLGYTVETCAILGIQMPGVG
jgi:hypothetical protein